MTNWRGIDVEAEGTGITRPLSEQVNLLGAMVGQAVRELAGDEIFRLVEELRHLCRDADEEDPAPRDEAASRIASLDLPTISWLLRAFATFFHLVNQAEKTEILRVNRERSRSDPDDRPRSESILEAVEALAGSGFDAEILESALERLDVQPTFTAHPTEARRRSTLDKQRTVARILRELQVRELTPSERERSLEELYRQVVLLLTSEEVPRRRPSVDEEVAQGLYFLTGSVWQVVPAIHRDLRRARSAVFDQPETARPLLPPFLRYRSWIGGDRDGNPNVTPDVTERTLQEHRREALSLYRRELEILSRELTVSERRVAVPDGLRRELGQEGPSDDEPLWHEPFRAWVDVILARIEEAASDASRSYRGTDLAADLERLAGWLNEAGLTILAEKGRLAYLRDRVRAFGFHLAALDLRQHSRVHEEAVDEILRLSGHDDRYLQRSEEQRRRILSQALEAEGDLLPTGASPGDSTSDLLATLSVVRSALRSDPGSVGSYIVSMTHATSDLLEVLVLLRAADLWRIEDGEVRCPLDVVPLYETIEDLEKAGERLRELFEEPIYRHHLESRDRFQEVMIGYSDSNKDGGYWMANWALHRGQKRIAEACADHDVGLRLFHGRGGTVGRGGGRANQAILALPAEVQNGRIRFTEQGEVISFRYSQTAIAHRHLEQIVNAMIRATARIPDDVEALDDEDVALLSRLGRDGMEAYRGLIDSDGFWSWYARVTPIEQISRLPISSRPVSRGDSDEVDFEGLRAIPWVFAWTQTRYNVPGWYGTGKALGEAVRKPETLERLRRLYREVPIVQALVDNAEREMARARLPISRRYAGLADDGTRFHRLIEDDFERARVAILAVTDEESLLDRNAVIQRSIELRNPYADVLNLLQIELLRRWRATGDETNDPEARDELLHALLSSIDGVAAAMQSTG